MTITDTRTTLVGRLRAAREFAGLDQSQIAEELGFTRTSISNWERGKASIPATAMIRWAEVTKISLDWIAWGTVRPEGFEPPAYCSVADPDDEDVEYWDPDFGPRGRYPMQGHRCSEGRHSECFYVGCECDCHGAKNVAQDLEQLFCTADLVLAA